MKNDFIIRGKEATLFVEAPPNVGYGSVEVKLDAADMDLVKSWPGTWFSFIHKRNGQLYIRATAHRVGGKVVNVSGFEQKQPLLHRVIAKPERGQNTIFKDGNSLQGITLLIFRTAKATYQKSLPDQNTPTWLRVSTTGKINSVTKSGVSTKEKPITWEFIRTSA